MGSLLVGLYGWVAIVVCGAVLLDVVYANSVRSGLDAAQAERLFNEPADFLLLLFAVAAAAAVAALGSAWHTRVRHLLLASATLLICQPIAGALLRPLLSDAAAGAWVRILLAAAASITALVAHTRLQRAA